MPFKEAVIALLDGLAPSAAAIDSVNTIVNDDGVLTGHNTDYGAVVDLLRDVDPATRFVLRGSGGMAKAVAAALRDSGFADGTIVARNRAAGEPLATLYGYRWAAELTEGAALLINVTPLGMTGADADALAFPAEMIADCTIAFDVVQYPPETPFSARRARRASAAYRHRGGDVAGLAAVHPVHGCDADRCAGRRGRRVRARLSRSARRRATFIDVWKMARPERFERPTLRFVV